MTLLNTYLNVEVLITDMEHGYSDQKIEKFSLRQCEYNDFKGKLSKEFLENFEVFSITGDNNYKNLLCLPFDQINDKIALRHTYSTVKEIN